jgi:tetratricopeptide (TPR) repeat protein
MGRKQTGTGQFIYFSIAVLIFSLLSNCVSLEKHMTLKTEGDTRKMENPEDAAKTLAADLERAAKLCSQGDYDGSLRETRRVLSLSGKNPPGDRALFNMALIYASSENPKKDYGQALLFLQRMLRDYPQSSLVEEAKTWAKVLQENERFRQESQRLRRVFEQSQEVDLLVDKKKREKAR